MENKPNTLQRVSYIANFADMIIDLAVIADVSERNKMIEILANNIKEQADDLQDDIISSIKSSSGSFLKDNMNDRNTSRK